MNSDLRDSKNAIIEIQPGGSMANAAVEDLREMYTRYAERSGWAVRVFDENTNRFGDARLALLLQGENAYRRLRWESGMHRVLSAGEDESRAVSALVSVNVLAELTPEEVEVSITDLAFRQGVVTDEEGKPAGQGIYLMHAPTSICVLLRRGEEALYGEEFARQKLWNLYYRIMNFLPGHAVRGEDRVREYHYPRGTVRDVRLSATFNLARVLAGELDPLLDGLARSTRRG